MNPSTILCPYCFGEIVPSARKCVHCGEPLVKRAPRTISEGEPQTIIDGEPLESTTALFARKFGIATGGAVKLLDILACLASTVLGCVFCFFAFGSYMVGNPAWAIYHLIFGLFMFMVSEQAARRAKR